MQSFIVYRNPVEAAFWEGVMNGSFFPIIVGIAVFFFVFFTLNSLLTKGKNYGQAWKTNLALAIGAIAGVVAVYFTV